MAGKVAGMSGQNAAGLDRLGLRQLHEAERDQFALHRPRSRQLGSHARRHLPNGTPMAWMAATYRHMPLFVDSAAGTRFTDVDGHQYVDFNLADMSVFTGYAPSALTVAICDRARRGTQFMLPGEDSVAAAAELARRFGLPMWQFTLSASQANAEVVRIARAITGRDKILMFDGKYHGHVDDVLIDLQEETLVAEQRGLPGTITARADIVQFNDLRAVAEILRRLDTALVLTEPVLTNNHGMVQPHPGYLDELRTLTAETGTLLALDETHTLVCGVGGLTRAWNQQPDFVTVGKSIAGGVPCGAYGMTPQVASAITYDYMSHDFRYADRVATGGTLFASALSMTAARTTLEQVLTAEAYEHAARLGIRLAAQLRTLIGQSGLPWSVAQLGPRCALYFTDQAPADARSARLADDIELRRWQRLYFANRGVWDAIVGAGPTVAVTASEQDIDLYAAVFRDWLAVVTTLIV